MPHVTLDGDSFLFDGTPTHPGRTWRGHEIEGLLMNSRVVQATFDDLNPATRDRWRMPDGSDFDADANTRRFCEELPAWHAAGLRAITVNLQGGSPQGYSREQPWHNSAFAPDGGMRDEYLKRMGRVLDAADRAGLAVILGLFYFGQDQRLIDEAAVVRAVDHVLDWLIARGDRHVLIEVCNECDNRGGAGYHHEVLRPPRVAELVRRCRDRGLLASVSHGGGRVPTAEVVDACGFLLIHGNGVADPDRMRRLIDATRAVPTYRGQPVVNNEDDHYAFDAADNNLVACVENRVGWGFFDYRRAGEPFAAGYQSVPTDWQSSHDRKRDFFRALAEVTGGDATETLRRGDARENPR